MRKALAFSFLAVATALAPPPAAQAGGQAIEVQMFTKVAEGDRPKIRVTATERVNSVTVSLERDDGKKFPFKLGAMSEGSFRELPLGGEPGKHHYSGKVVAAIKGDRQEDPIEFDAVVAPPLQILVDKSKVDLRGHHLELKLSRAAGKVEIKVLGDSGMPLAEEEHDFSGKAAGTPLEVTWNPRAPGDPVKIELRAYDADGFFSGLALMPWSVYIPHEEVNFRTDSFEIDATEKPKLDASYSKVNDALTKYRELGNIKLFIAGHTDTQGSAEYNVGLSQRRAQAIGTWFRRRGLRIPIAYEGFGEFAPIVRTADNVDEPRNRRVDYILAVEEPVLKATGFRASWKRVN